MRYAAYDIGGANIKRLVATDKNNLEVLSSDIFHFPLWRKKDELEGFLRGLKINADLTAITMSGELCDCFSSKSEGVEYITSTCDAAFGNPLYLTIDGELKKSRDLWDPKMLAASNFVASIAYLEENFDRGILLDMGSTTTDIVPFEKEKKLHGLTDFDRLASGQLVYTGLHRTPVCAIAHEVPYKAGFVQIASEVFAISADMYNILGQCEYTCETPDGKGKTIEDSLRRLSRQLCADLTEMDEQELRGICKYLRSAQVDLISRGLKKVSQGSYDVVYLCGIGEHIASLACERVGLRFVDLSLETRAHENLPCFGIAWMLSKY